METGTINIRLRPIRLGFLVDPSDKRALLEAIRLNTFLWGGGYNPIIPVVKNLSKYWRDYPRERVSRESIVSGYLDAFDPDYVIPLGSCKGKAFDFGYRELIDSDEILSDFDRDWTPKYGIGLIEILRNLMEEEMKFVRREQKEFVIPRCTGPYEVFVSSVIGILPACVERILLENYSQHLTARQAKYTVHDYAELLNPKLVFPRRITYQQIDSIPSRRSSHHSVVFLLDASSHLDVIDYWNLKALGKEVIPVAIQARGSAALDSLIKRFVVDNYYPDRLNPKIYHEAMVIGSRSINDRELEKYILHLNQSIELRSKFVWSEHYPAIWKKWYRENSDGYSDEIMVDDVDYHVSNFKDPIMLKTLDPKFVSRYISNGSPRFVNEIKMRLFGGVEPIAEVLPEADERLSNSIGALGIQEFRFSRRGIVYLARHSRWSFDIQIPAGENVLLDWLRLKGWKATVSSPGMIAKQMLKNLGGGWGVHFLANEGLIKLLGTMNQTSKTHRELISRLDELKNLWVDGDQKEFSDKAGRIINDLGLLSVERTLNQDELLGELAKAFGKSEQHADYIGTLRQLLAIKIFQLGLLVSCTECQRPSLFALNEIGYELKCPKCLATFPFPLPSKKDIHWGYRTTGPFSLANEAFGAYSVLLTLRFFSHVLAGAITPCMSFEATKEGKKGLEADLALFYQGNRFGESRVEVIFVECKSYNGFEQRDVSRLRLIAEEFPGSTLVFATLNKQLSTKEIRLIRPFAEECRKKSINTDFGNRVLVLTGVELFCWYHLDEAWSNHGGRHAELSRSHYVLRDLGELCNTTEQLYLEMIPYDDWITKHYEKLRSRRATAK
jgi:hypothetical protein